MDEEIKKRIAINEYTIAKKEFEIVSMYLSDTHKYVPADLRYEIRITQETLAQFAQVMQDLIDSIENFGQPEKLSEEELDD